MFGSPSTIQLTKPLAAGGLVIRRRFRWVIGPPRIGGGW